MQRDLHIVVNRNTPYVVQAFEHLGKVTALGTHEITNESVRDADVLIVRSETKVNEALLNDSRVRFVGTVTIGTDHIDESYLARKGIVFASAPGSNANSVAEYIISALLESARRKDYELRGKTIGIVGVGNIGSKVWQKVEALGMQVLLNDPPLQRNGIKYPLHSLDELMEADIITLHVPLTTTGFDATYHLFNEAQIHKMKHDSILINTSRGGVVEEKALKRALVDGHLAFAILDVWEGEPNIDASILDQVLLGTPHIAGYSLDGKINALRMIYKAVCRFLSEPEKLEIDSLLPLSAIPEINLNALNQQQDLMLYDIVKQCYDIHLDDQSLREIVLLPLPERGKHFMKLRANYRIRREFFNTTINVSKNIQEIGRVLESIGFKVKSI
jgi:erythronate-4-phosphate dehydrogenase